MMKRLSLVIIIACIFIIPSCSKKPEIQESVVTFTSGIFKINNQDASTGSRVHDNDILSTYDNSLAVVQVSQTAVIIMRQNTVVKFDRMIFNKDESQEISLSLLIGSTFHKVMRKGTSYSVITPTATASVRGTSFEVTVDELKSRVSLLNGKVAVTRKGEVVTEDKIIKEKETRGIDLAEGQSITVTRQTIEEPVVLEKWEVDNLMLLDTVVPVPDVEKTIPQKEGKLEQEKIQMPPIEIMTEQVKELILKGEVHDAKPEDKPKEKPVHNEKPKDKETIYREKLNEIKDENNGKLDKITLRNGNIIMGRIIERGIKYKIKTPDGTIEIQPGDIETQTIIH